MGEGIYREPGINLPKGKESEINMCACLLSFFFMFPKYWSVEY